MTTPFLRELTRTLSSEQGQRVLDEARKLARTADQRARIDALRRQLLSRPPAGPSDRPAG
jgi:hypothetical protein